jgi:hypothetical protein
MDTDMEVLDVMDAEVPPVLLGVGPLTALAWPQVQLHECLHELGKTTICRWINLRHPRRASSRIWWVDDL